VAPFISLLGSLRIAGISQRVVSPAINTYSWIVS